MKSLLNLFFALLLCLGLLPAQDCESYFPFQEGAEWTMTSYNKKGKEQGSMDYTIKSLVVAEDMVTGQFNAEMKSGKETYDYDFTATCQDGALTVDMASIYRSLAMDGMSGTEFEITSDVFQLPYPVKDGTQLPDIEMKVAMVGSPVEISVTVRQSDRHVVSHESMTTPAGTYDCVKITYTSNVKAMIVNRSMQITEWHAPGVGVVRSEIYRKGKLDSYTELTSFSL